MSNQEELQRQLREIQLQRQLEMRRHAIPRFGPAVDGVLWSRVPPEEDTDKTRQGRILSILELPLKPGIDMHNDSSSNPSRKLWDAALRYISSIPGCCAVEWAQGLEDPGPPVTLLCMIHWDSVVAWRKFQHSLGFTPLIALLHSDVSNRCAKLDVSGTPRLADAEGGTSIVDVISVTFPISDGWSPDGRSAFEESWNALVALVTNGPDGPRHSFAVWLESNASTFFDPTPAEAAASTKTATFTAFLAWDGTHYGSHRVDSLCDSLRASLLASYGDGPSLSRRAAQLISQIQPEDHDPRRQPAAPLNSLPDILEAGFLRQCSADLANLREHAAQALARSISDVRARTRLFPAPQGSFISQGELYDGNMPVIPEWRSMRGPVHGYHLVDVAWMQLKDRVSAIQGRHIYNQLDNEISALPGFVKTFLAHDAENEAKVAVLTVWEDQDARAAALPEYRRILDELARSSVHVAAPLTHQAFSMARDPGPCGLWLNQVNYLELTSFHVPTGAVERKLFEHAYGAFARFVTLLSPVHLAEYHTTVQLTRPWRSSMTEPSVVAGIPKACIVSDAGGWQPAEEAGSSDLQLFTGVLTWVSPAARHEWYGELFNLSRGSYELFGHRLDALKILATGGVTTRFLALQR